MSLEESLRRLIREEVRPLLSEVRGSPNRALTTAEVAEALGVVPRVVVDMIHANEIRGWRLHGDRGDWRISLRDLERFMDERAEAA